MANIQDLLINYTQIVGIIRKAGAQNIKIFKGFSDQSSHDLNLFIIRYQENNQNLTVCKADIMDGLTSLLKCTVCVTDKQSMPYEFYEQLDPSNSFELSLQETETLETREQLRHSLQHIFGLKWDFIKRETYDKEATQEEWGHYCNEMRDMEQRMQQDGFNRQETSYAGRFFHKPLEEGHQQATPTTPQEWGPDW